MFLKNQVLNVSNNLLSTSIKRKKLEKEKTVNELPNSGLSCFPIVGEARTQFMELNFVKIDGSYGFVGGDRTNHFS